jgi:hypothetical protein
MNIVSRVSFLEMIILLFRPEKRVYNHEDGTVLCFKTWKDRIYITNFYETN